MSASLKKKLGHIFKFDKVAENHKKKENIVDPEQRPKQKKRKETGRYSKSRLMCACWRPSLSKTLLKHCHAPVLPQNTLEYISIH